MKRYIFFLVLNTMAMQGYTQMYKTIMENCTLNNYKNLVFQQNLNTGWLWPAIGQAAELVIEQCKLTKVTNEQVCAFVREQLAQAGVEEPERISVMRGAASHYAAGINYIAMHDAVYKQLKQLLRTLAELTADPQADQELVANTQATLNAHIAIIQHEAAHLKYHDNLNHIIVLAAVGGALDWLWHKVAPLIGAQAYMRGRESYTDASYLKLTALSLVRTSLCKLVMCAYSHIVEWRADGNIAQDINLLKGAEKFFTDVHTGIKNHWAQRGMDMDKYPFLTYVIDPNHPRACKRAEACAERIAALELAQAA